MTLIMGVLNVTPDSFSDGGLWLEPGAAIEHALDLVEQGADIIDVGGESTRPGALRVDPAEEQARVVPVVRELARRGITVSVDTMNAGTARETAAVGAAIINDVSGGLADPGMPQALLDTGLQYVVMHWRGQSDSMDSLARYTDTVGEVRAELSARVTSLLEVGIDPSRLILDPGLGFSKTGEHNWQVLAGLPELETLGYPILIGASRKRFLGALLDDDAPATDRDAPTAVISALAAREGAWAVRVHDVASTRIALDVVRAWQAGRDD
ncbi:dihydropteroate synthase [Leifsonia sp. Root227]|uniref:dihydropteroate synthase n=1 Tax=unclassified Leifsonia TaxID=2663824 RepID=UPI0006F25C3C|nr:dihydropteroate synthase [Leifsonia sp. Root227]KRC45352.1 dihydropteroate synthase [Leifsonia sp. Root227]